MISPAEKILQNKQAGALLYEEDSYFFLQEYQLLKNWHVYDSKQGDISNVKALVNDFASFHGKIPFSTEFIKHFKKDEITQRYWSAIPLGIFCYKMLQNGYFDLLDSVKNEDGYIVHGAYWDNGFFYFVYDKNQIIQAKLFVDTETKKIHAYPDIL